MYHCMLGHLVVSFSINFICINIATDSRQLCCLTYPEIIRKPIPANGDKVTSFV